MIDKTQIQRNLEDVLARIASAAAQAGRDPKSVQLVVVTKGHPVQVVSTLLVLGVRDIGESYAEEARAKQVALGPNANVKWHMIGHVQSRKAQVVAQNFQMLHSLDSLKLAHRLDKFAAEANRRLPVLMECKVSGETSKTGWEVIGEGNEETFLKDVEEITKLPNLEIHGLMSIAPRVDRQEDARPFFAKTRALGDKLTEKYPEASWEELSMGMSDDFEAAILEGATIVRVGSAILGPREG